MGMIGAELYLAGRLAMTRWRATLPTGWHCTHAHPTARVARECPAAAEQLLRMASAAEAEAREVIRQAEELFGGRQEVD